MDQIQIITEPSEFKKEIVNEVKEQLDEFLRHFKPKPPNEYLSRTEVSILLHVNLSTVHNWTVKGILKAYSIGGRIFYLKEDIEASLIPLNH